jgi:uncharacterized membrane protein
MKPLLSLILIVVSIAYPLFVYMGVQHLSPAFFALVLAGLGIGKFVVGRKSQAAPERGQWWTLALVLAYSLAILITNNTLLLTLYPVIISLGMAYLFASSLKAPESLIERFARLAGETITPRAKHYTRRLTGIWALLLIANAGVALYLALWGDLKSWALYSGLISYLLFGGFFALEYGYRRYYIHKYRDQP